MRSSSQVPSLEQQSESAPAAVDESGPLPESFFAPLEFHGLVAGTELLLTSRTLEIRREQAADTPSPSGTGHVRLADIAAVSVRRWPAGPATLQVQTSSGILEIVLPDPAVAERARAAIEAARQAGAATPNEGPGEAGHGRGDGRG